MTKCLISDYHPIRRLLTSFYNMSFERLSHYRELKKIANLENLFNQTEDSGKYNDTYSYKY